MSLAMATSSFRGTRDAVMRLLETEPLDQRLEAVAVLGEIDGVG